MLNEGEKEKIKAEENPQNIQHTPSTPASVPTQTEIPPSMPTSSSQPKTIAPRDISSAIDPKNIIEGSRTRRSVNLAYTNNDHSPQNYLSTEFAYVGIADTSDTPTVEEAMKRSDWPQFKAAMDVEMETMRRTGTFGDGPIQRPIGRNIVGSKWALRIKRKANSEIDKYKARLVARGFTQVQGVDYYETFSPTAKLSSLRTILSIATRFDWDIKVFDYSAAFLNGEFAPDEEIYMEQAPYYTNGNSQEVIRLHRTIYGLAVQPKMVRETYIISRHPRHPSAPHRSCRLSTNSRK